MVSCWKMAERSRDWFSPVREPEFWPKTWFCAVDWTPVANVGDTLTRRKELLLLFQRWSSRADHRLVFSVTGKFPRREASGTNEVGNAANPLPPGVQVTVPTVALGGQGMGSGNRAPGTGPGLLHKPRLPQISPGSTPFTATLAADPTKVA